MIEIKRVSSAADVAAEAARLAAEHLLKVQQSHEEPVFVLAGGRLPPVAYDILADSYTNTFDWAKIYFAIGDERCVPLNSPDNSWQNAASMFAKHPEIPANHLLRPDSQLSAEKAAEQYEKMLLTLTKNASGLPVLHHLWMGIGEDGHTLSLFPNHSETAQIERLVIPVHNAPKPPPDRISLSFHALTTVQLAIAFVSGDSKADIVAQIAAGNVSLPIVQASQVIAKSGGQVIWLVDTAASSKLGDTQLVL